MNAVNIIAKKRDGGELNAGEIGEFVRGVADGSVPDYQQAAWLMAVFLRGMTERETLDLTLAMRDSGDVIDLSDLPGGPALDKHSTGGVGDKTTLVVVPLLAALGVPMLKMSGRGLGFSGGTVDKLESIPGFRAELSVEEAKRQVRRVGAALVAQSERLAPADRALYALRDVTATVECLPLIAASIMSKKLASGAGRIVLDVKVGRGAFMRTRAEAERLARAMVGIGNGAGVPTSAVLTLMEEPLGRNIGNALEVREALETLADYESGEARFRDLCLELAAHALVETGRCAGEGEARARVREAWAGGAAARKFVEIVRAQGGPTDIAAALPKAPVRHAVPGEAGGVVAGIEADTIGRLAVEMGAGRLKKGDPIDPAVGIVLNRKTGDAVTPGETLAVLHLRAGDAARAGEFAEVVRAAYRVTPAAEAGPAPGSLVLGVVEG